MPNEDAKNDRCDDLLGELLSFDAYDGAAHEIYCILEAGHDGPHRDEFEHGGQSVVIAWHTSDSAMLISNDEYLPLAREAEPPTGKR